MVVSLLPEEPKKKELSFTETSQQAVVDPAKMTQQAEYADYAMGDKSPGLQRTAAYIFTGNQDTLNRTMALARFQENQKKRADVIRSAVQKATDEGRELTGEEYDQIQKLSNADLSENHETIIEKMYAERLAKDSIVKNETATPEQADEPEQVDQVYEAMSAHVYKQETVKRLLTHYQGVMQNNGILSNVWDIGRSFVPWYTAASLQGVKMDSVNDEVFGGWFLNPGGTQVSRNQGAFFLPPEEFERAVTDFARELNDKNSSFLAVQFLKNLLDYSSTDAVLDTSFALLDSTIIGGAVLDTVKGVKGIARINGGRNFTKADRLVLTGNAPQAAREEALKRAQTILNPVEDLPDPTTGVPRPKQQATSLMAQGPAILDPDVLKRGPGSLSNEQANRLTEELSKQADVLLSTLDDPAVVRMGEAATAEALVRAEKALMQRVSKAEDGVVEIVHVRESEEAFGGVDRVDAYLGDTAKRAGFQTPEKAQTYAGRVYRLREGTYTIDQVGNSWYIRVSKHVDETDPTIERLRIDTDNTTPKSFLNTVLGFARGADHVASDAVQGAKKLSINAANNTLGKFRDALAPLKNINKEQVLRLEDMVESSQLVNKKFFDNYFDYETEYTRRYNAPPTPEEAAAYFTYKNVADFKYLQDNLSAYRDKARLGVENHSFVVRAKNAEGKSEMLRTDNFEARPVERIEGDGGGVLYLNEKGEPKFVTRGREPRGTKSFAKQKQEFDEMLESGEYKILQVVNPYDEALSKLKKNFGAPINYVIVRETKTRPLSFKQVEYNPSGNGRYGDDVLYLKQPAANKLSSGVTVYNGDKTAFVFTVRSEAKKFAEAFEKARQMLVRGAPEKDITAFVRANLPFADAAEFMSNFRGIAGGADDAPFSLNVPFTLVSPGQRTTDTLKFNDLFGDDWIDVYGDTHSLAPKIGNYSGGDPLNTITKSQDTAAFNIVPARQMNLLDGVGRTVNSLVRDRYFRDLKHRAVEDWATEFGEYVNTSTADLRANPMKYIRDGADYRKNLSKDEITRAELARKSLLDFLSLDDPDTTAWKTLRQRVVDSVYDKTGTELIDPLKWTKNADPSTVARSAVFHAKLGMFNPLQFGRQAAGALHAMAIDGNPIRSAQSVYIYWAMRMAEMGSGGNMSKLWSGTAKALGINKADLDEIYHYWRATGSNVVEGEYGLATDYLSPNLFQGIGGKALDGSLMFFREGNKVHKSISFILAFMKYREANKLGKLTNSDLTKIMTRADAMYVNMTRASNSLSQKGWTAVPQQFFGYHLRMTEQMLSKKITWPERLRIMSAYGLMYGMPTGLLGTTLGAFWPWREQARQAALEAGVAGDNFLMNTLIDGLPSALMSMAGVEYDVAAAFGPSGLSWLKDLVSGDITQSFGAGPNFLGQVIETGAPFVKAIQGAFTSDNGDDYPLAPQDFWNAAKNITTISLADKIYVAATTGLWMMKNGNPTARIDNDFWDLVAIGLGMTPQQVVDTYLMNQSNQGVEQTKARIGRLAIQDFNRGLKSSGQERQMYFKRARAWTIAAGLTPSEEGELFNRALKQANGSMLEDVMTEFYENNRETRGQMYSDTMKRELGF